MLHPRAPIPIVTLVLSAACQPKEPGATGTDTGGTTGTDTVGVTGGITGTATGGITSTATGTDTVGVTGTVTGGPTSGSSGTDTGDVTATEASTSEPPEFPAVQCDSMRCAPGQFCLFIYDLCTLVPSCYDDTETTGGGSGGISGNCWTLPDLHDCRPIPRDCLPFTIQSEEFADCVEYHYEPGCWGMNDFADGKLTCQYDYICNEDIDYFYCLECE